jgi:hypothetical protein
MRPTPGNDFAQELELTMPRRADALPRLDDEPTTTRSFADPPTAVMGARAMRYDEVTDFDEPGRTAVMRKELVQALTQRSREEGSVTSGLKPLVPTAEPNAHAVASEANADPLPAFPAQAIEQAFAVDGPARTPPGGVEARRDPARRDPTPAGASPLSTAARSALPPPAAAAPSPPIMAVPSPLAKSVEPAPTIIAPAEPTTIASRSAAKSASGRSTTSASSLPKTAAAAAPSSPRRRRLLLLAAAVLVASVGGLGHHDMRWPGWVTRVTHLGHATTTPSLTVGKPEGQPTRAPIASTVPKAAARPSHPAAAAPQRTARVPAPSTTARR